MSNCPRALVWTGHGTRPPALENRPSHHYFSHRAAALPEYAIAGEDVRFDALAPKNVRNGTACRLMTQTGERAPDSQTIPVSRVEHALPGSFRAKTRWHAVAADSAVCQGSGGVGAE
jgi:hypothetical protein